MKAADRFRIGLFSFVLCAMLTTSWIAHAQVAPAVATADAAADLAARVADLEAYINNTAPKTLSAPGPGHNAWMMASCALVLFMTLPGLALVLRRAGAQ